MFSIDEFLQEVDQVFGFYFDIGLACYIAFERIQRLQQDAGINDDSPFSYSDGPPVGTPDQEIERSLHATTIGGVKIRLGNDAFDITRAAEAAVVFAYHIWEEKYRRHLVDRHGHPIGEVQSDIMGDLRLIRNAIIHNKGIAQCAISGCKKLTRFKPDDKIVLRNTDIYLIIREMRADLGKYA